MKQHTRFQAIERIVPLDYLASKCILVVGVGSGGSMVAEYLARLGFGWLILLERFGESIEEHNVIRHILGYPWLGRPKIEGVKARIREINPACQVEMIEADVVIDSARVARLISGCDHIACCVDNEPAKQSTNEIALILRISATFGGVYENGIGGEVFLYRPGGGCYACFSRQAQRGIPVPGEERPAVDYLSLETLEADVFPATGLDVSQIALIQARVALMTILEAVAPDQALPGNFVLFGNRPYEDIFPRVFHNEIRQIELRPECLVCGAPVEEGADIASEAARIRSALGVSAP